MKLSFGTKLQICWTILFPKTEYSWDEREKPGFIFQSGYKMGIKDAKIEGSYKVKVIEYVQQQENVIDFDTLDEALRYVKKYYRDSLDVHNYCELYQVFLDRDMSDLLTDLRK